MDNSFCHFSVNRCRDWGFLGKTLLFILGGRCPFVWSASYNFAPVHEFTFDLLQCLLEQGTLAKSNWIRSI